MYFVAKNGTLFTERTRDQTIFVKTISQSSIRNHLDPAKISTNCFQKQFSEFKSSAFEKCFITKQFVSSTIRGINQIRTSTAFLGSIWGPFWTRNHSFDRFYKAIWHCRGPFGVPFGQEIIVFDRFYKGFSHSWNPFGIPVV